MGVGIFFIVDAVEVDCDNDFFFAGMGHMTWFSLGLFFYLNGRVGYFFI
jgi:hypothetical protein